MLATSTINTLEYDADLCNGCRMCSMVCPHDVFAVNNGKADADHSAIANFIEEMADTVISGN